MNNTKVKPVLTAEQIKKLTALIEAGQKNVWQPKEGETLFGRLKNISVHRTKKGKKLIVSKLYLFETNEGERALWGSTVIENRFKELGIKGNDFVGIKFLGKKKNYKNYEVAKL